MSGKSHEESVTLSDDLEKQENHEIATFESPEKSAVTEKQSKMYLEKRDFVDILSPFHVWRRRLDFIFAYILAVNLYERYSDFVIALYLIPVLEIFLCFWRLQTSSSATKRVLTIILIASVIGNTVFVLINVVAFMKVIPWCDLYERLKVVLINVVAFMKVIPWCDLYERLKVSHIVVLVLILTAVVLEIWARLKWRC
ncbi:hypothetical protein I9W82_004932 [Candida metapsilosis]|uniref:Uncharacterized protein n=1 Tax=Candida metapsilosis TaxID=273372 RepID=A0A8H7ZBP1_9ASCO|nr:hypothetical protein I9W82_004932 [Candida metapsilosis]